MVGKPGRSGTNKGKDKPFKEALLLAIKRAEEKGGLRALDSVADKLIEEAKIGNMQAIQEIANRLDGKPSQQVELSGEGGGPVEVVIQGTDTNLL